MRFAAAQLLILATFGCGGDSSGAPATDTTGATEAVDTTTAGSGSSPVSATTADTVGTASEASSDGSESSTGGPNLPPTALQIAAEALQPGEHVFFSTVNTLQAENDIQWNNRTIYYDAARRELQYMGKPASSQSQAYAHFIYVEVTDEWVAPIAAPIPWPTGTGHIWMHTFDPANGDYWTKPYGNGVHYMRYFDRSDATDTEYGSWKDTPSQVDPELGNGNATGPGPMYHPNLFGAGNPGIFYWGIFRAFAYDLTAASWSVVAPENWDNPSPYFNRGTGNGVYVPTLDQAIMFADGRDGTDEPLIISAAAGNSEDVLGDGMVALGADPPIEVTGGGGDTIHGHAVNHPDDADRILLLEEKGSGRVWESSDGAQSWSEPAPDVHPFDLMSNWSAGEWTCGVIPQYGVIVGMTSNGSGGDFVIWKPSA